MSDRGMEIRLVRYILLNFLSCSCAHQIPCSEQIFLFSCFIEYMENKARLAQEVRMEIPRHKELAELKRELLMMPASNGPRHD